MPIIGNKPHRNNNNTRNTFTDPQLLPQATLGSDRTSCVRALSPTARRRYIRPPEKRALTLISGVPFGQRNSILRALLWRRNTTTTR